MVDRTFRMSSLHTTRPAMPEAHRIHVFGHLQSEGSRSRPGLVTLSVVSAAAITVVAVAAFVGVWS